MGKKRHRVGIKASAKLTNYIPKIAGEVAVIDMSKFLGDFAEKKCLLFPPPSECSYKPYRQ